MRVSSDALSLDFYKGNMTVKELSPQERVYVWFRSSPGPNDGLQVEAQACKVVSAQMKLAAEGIQHFYTMKAPNGLCYTSTRELTFYALRLSRRAVQVKICGLDEISASLAGVFCKRIKETKEGIVSAMIPPKGCYFEEGQTLVKASNMTTSRLLKYSPDERCEIFTTLVARGEFSLKEIKFIRAEYMFDSEEIAGEVDLAFEILVASPEYFAYDAQYFAILAPSLKGMVLDFIELNKDCSDRILEMIRALGKKGLFEDFSYDMANEIVDKIMQDHRDIIVEAMKYFPTASLSDDMQEHLIDLDAEKFFTYLPFLPWQREAFRGRHKPRSVRSLIKTLEYALSGKKRESSRRSSRVQKAKRKDRAKEIVKTLVARNSEAREFLIGLTKAQLNTLNNFLNDYDCELSPGLLASSGLSN